MNRELNRMILRLVLAFCVAAPSPVAVTKSVQVPPSADAKQQLLDLEEEWIRAEHSHDAAALRRILADKFVATFGTAKLYDKDSFIKDTVQGDIDPTESQKLTDRTVILDGDTAIVVGTDTERGTRKGVAYTAVGRYTATYIHRDGRWIALAEHFVEIPHAR